jgi:hypothetical protein
MSVPPLLLCQHKEDLLMKTLIVALSLALGVATSALAGDVSAAKSEADCSKAGGIWNAETSTCAEKPM